MKTRITPIVLAAVSLLVAVALGALPAPQDFTAAWDTDVLECDWTDVVGATKYSVDITATATYDTGYVDEEGDPILAEVEVQASFGTSDRTDGDPMGQSDLDIPQSDIEDLLDALDAALADLGIDPGDVVGVELEAKVKALDSGNGKGKQNNPFSDAVSVPLP